MNLARTPGPQRLAPLPLRLTMGLIMTAHGRPKMFGEAKESFPTLVESLAVPQSSTVARAISMLEFFGGIAIVGGFMTRLFALLFAGQFLFIVFRMKWSKGLVEGFEFDLALLGGFLALAILGGGAGSLDEILLHRR